jgi:hypothetical protein
LQRSETSNWKSDFEELVIHEPGNAVVFKAAVDIQPEVNLLNIKD